VNVLILTPDAVGSTLLQRLITIYMQFHEFDRPVINLHELTMGLERYYSADFNREIVSKSRVTKWGYHQSLEQIVEMLDSVEHYKTARLAQYHVRNRRDPMEQQVPFYRYLDDNFFVIACRRHNVFEHAVSMTINNTTKKLNVYSHEEKIDTFLDMYVNPIHLDQIVLLGQLESYRQYLSWSHDHFNVASYFYLDQHLDDIEHYILNLPIFRNQVRRIGWQEKFNIDIRDWNRMHHISSDFGLLGDDALRSLRPLLAGDGQPTTDVTPQSALMPRKMHDLIAHDHAALRRFVTENQCAYDRAQEAIDRMQQLDIIPSPPPIKKQTLSDKLRMISNFDECVDTFNSWARHHPEISPEITRDQIDTQLRHEDRFWRSYHHTTSPLCDPPTTARLGYQNDDDRGPSPAAL
jgi:hypothetical protein